MTGASAQNRLPGLSVARIPALGLLGVVAAVVVGFVTTARAGALTLVGVLAVAAVVRAVARARPGDGIVVRSRGVDVATLLGFALVIATLAVTTPDI